MPYNFFYNVMLREFNIKSWNKGLCETSNINFKQQSVTDFTINVYKLCEAKGDKTQLHLLKW